MLPPATNDGNEEIVPKHGSSVDDEGIVAAADPEVALLALAPAPAAAAAMTAALLALASAPSKEPEEDRDEELERRRLFAEAVVAVGAVVTAALLRKAAVGAATKSLHHTLLSDD